MIVDFNLLAASIVFRLYQDSLGQVANGIL